MALTVDEIRIQAQLLGGIQIDAQTNLIWVKQGINDIVRQFGQSAAQYEQEDYETTENYETYQPQHEIVLIDKVLDRSGGALCRTQEYALHGEELTMYAPGKYQLRYYRMPDMPEVVTDTVALPNQYANALKFYCAARIRARVFGQDDQSAVSMMEEFKNTAKEAATFMRLRDKHTKKMPPSTWKG